MKKLIIALALATAFAAPAMAANFTKAIARAASSRSGRRSNCMSSGHPPPMRVLV